MTEQNNDSDMHVFILPELLDAFAKAPPIIRENLSEFIGRFRSSPSSASEGVPVEGAPEEFRLFQVNSAWSLVAAFPVPGLALLLTANWTGSAQAWARSHTLVPSVLEGGGAVWSAKHEPVPAEEPEPEPAPALFKDISDSELASVGLPEALVPLIRSFTESRELEENRSRIPAETYESLLWYTQGAQWSAVEREYAKLHHKAESQMGKMRLYLNPQQQQIVEGPWCHAMLVQGGAGTGKSVVAMHRAKHLVELPDWKESDRLLFVTATHNLAVDIAEQLSRLVRPDRLRQIEVADLDGWVKAFLRRTGYKPSMVYPANQSYRDAWKATTALMPEGCTEAEAREEFERVVLPNNIRLLRTYLRTRASELPQSKREALWPVFDAFRKELINRGKVAAADAYFSAIGALTEDRGAASFPYRAVVADEIQDFGPEAFRLLRALCPDHDADATLSGVEGDLFLVGDTRERIYGRDISFASCGISIKGERTRNLSLSYRTTAEIAAAAQAVLNGGSSETRDPRNAPETVRHGPMPKLFVGEEFDQEVSWIVRQIHELIEDDKNLPLSSIVIAARTDSLLDDYQGALGKRGIRTLQISRNIADDPNAAGVRSATLHRLKGLEFRAVFIVGADDGNLPDALTVNAASTCKDRQEAEKAERVLFHVAATRAVDRLYVSCSDTPGEYLRELLEFEKAARREG